MMLMVFSVVNALSVHGLKTLVVYDKRITELDDYSSFFDSLKQRSYEINFASVNDDSDSIALYSGQERLYDNVIVFPVKSRQISKSFTTSKLLQFYVEGGDVLSITTPDAVPETVRSFLNELGIYPSPKDFHVVDYKTDAPVSSLELSGDEAVNKYVYTNSNGAILKYEGSCALLDNGDLIVDILPAPRTSVCRDSKKNTEDWTTGSQGHLIAGFQNLVDARTTWIGSDTFFNNDHFENNSEFIEQLTKWTFREKSVLRSAGVKHNHIDGTSFDDVPYKVKDLITYEIGLSIWNGEEWTPFLADDVQFELKLVDPYYRLTLTPSTASKDAQFYTTGELKLPNHHGVFTFLTEYKRNGLTTVTESDVKAIRHLANDEYARSFEITNSWVYLTTIFSVIILFLLFIVFFISSSTTANVDPVKKQQ